MKTKIFEFNGPAKELLPAIDKLIRDMERTEQQIYAVYNEIEDMHDRMIAAVLEDSVRKENERAARLKKHIDAFDRILKALEE